MKIKIDKLYAISKVTEDESYVYARLFVNKEEAEELAKNYNMIVTEVHINEE